MQSACMQSTSRPLLLVQYAIFAPAIVCHCRCIFSRPITVCLSSDNQLESFEASNLQASDTTMTSRVLFHADDTSELYTFATMLLHHWYKVLCCNLLHHGFLQNALYNCQQNCGVQYKHTGDGVFPFTTFSAAWEWWVYGMTLCH